MHRTRLEIAVLAYMAMALLVGSAGGQTMWTKIYGGPFLDGASSCQQTLDGGYVAVGGTMSFGAGDLDVWIVRTDAWGDTLWTKTYGRGAEDMAYAVQQTLDGGFVVAGWTESPGQGDFDVWLLKTDAWGDTLWTKTYGGSDDEQAYYLQQTTDGGYVIAAHTASVGPGRRDLWLIKTDAAGDTLWTRVLGGTLDDWPCYVQQTEDGGYILTGRIQVSMTRVALWLVKMDASGGTQWTKTYGGEIMEWGVSVEQTPDGGYIVGGFVSSPITGVPDAWILKTDGSGDTLWTRRYGGHGWDQACRVQRTSDGGYVMVGMAESFGAGSSDAWLVRMDERGDTLWTRTYGGTGFDVGGFGQQTLDGGYFLAGYTDSYGAGENDMLLIKTDTGGNTQWLTAEPEVRCAPTEYSMVQCSPNPFTGTASIRYQTPAIRHLELAVLDPLGRHVRLLASGRHHAGVHRIIWDGRDRDGARLPAGVYLCRLTAGSLVSTDRIIVFR